MDWQRGAENVQVDDKTAKLLDIFRSAVPRHHPGAAADDDNHHNNGNNDNDAALSLSGRSEVPVVYADEGTPPVFSETSSLSALTVDGMVGTGVGGVNAAATTCLLYTSPSPRDK